MHKLYALRIRWWKKKGFRHERYDVCHRGFVDCYSTNLPIKVLQDPLKKRKYDISESIDFEEKERFRDVERGFCSSGTTCTIRDTGEIASPWCRLQFVGRVQKCREKALFMIRLVRVVQLVKSLLIRGT